MYEPVPPRQKSCKSCKAAKRRCDLGNPACSRCALKNAPCIYPGRQPQLPSEAHREILCEYDILTAPASDATVDFNSYPALDNAPEIQSTYGGQSSFSTVPQGIETPQNDTLARPRVQSLRSLPETFTSHLQFAINVLKDAPNMMILENKTPWCHQQLYKNYMPKDMQDAYACCSLQMSKNEINAPALIAIYDARIQDLLSAPESKSLLECLAHTHALILYLIICLFDGDIRLHAKADFLCKSLEYSAYELLAHLQMSGIVALSDLSPSAIESTINFWNSWVLQESAQRTVLLTLYFLQIYKLLRGDIPSHCDRKLGLYSSWYSSAHLWNSSSVFDFSTTWVDKPHFIVDDLDFSFVLKNAMPEDIDLFGRMFLVTLLGIDGAKAWFTTRGASL